IPARRPQPRQRVERAGIENPDRLIAAGAGEAAVQLGDQRHPMHAGRVGDLAHEGARIGVDHDHARAAGDVEPAAGRVEGKAVAKVEEGAAAGAALVCLPELFRSLYFAQREDAALFDLAEPVPGPTTDVLGKVAKRARVVVIAPIFERRAPGLYHNTAAVIDADGRLVGLYRKMHIPDDPAYYEKFYFTPGDLGFRVFDTRVGRIGTLVCWDQWYPEGARLTALQGANILFYPTAIGWHPKEKASHGPQQLDAWRTMQRSDAIANGLYV